MNATTRLVGISDNLVLAALTRRTASQEAWNYGWCLRDYRWSAEAAITHSTSANVRLSANGVQSIETAMQSLLHLPSVRELYDPKEVWGLVASIVGSLPLTDDPDVLRARVDERLFTLTVPPDSCVIVPIANLDPGAAVIEVGSLFVGRFGDDWRNLLKLRARGSKLLSCGDECWWASQPTDGAGDDLVLMSYFGRSQLGRAFREAEETFENLIALALALEPDLDGTGLYSLRGDSHRPGIRGLAVDRQGLQRAPKALPTLNRELGSDVVIDDILGPRVTHHWYGEKPFPLHQLLSGDRIDEVRRLLVGQTSVHHRVRVAARWHAKAYWSHASEDAVLALGIAFDSLLSESTPSPGRVLAERFAFLSPSVEERPLRYKLFIGEYYSARSSIAHGRKKGTIDAKFVRRMATDVRYIFRKLASLAKAEGLESEDALAKMFEKIKWGTERADPGG